MILADASAAMQQHVDLLSGTQRGDEDVVDDRLDAFGSESFFLIANWLPDEMLRSDLVVQVKFVWIRRVVVSG